MQCLVLFYSYIKIANNNTVELTCLIGDTSSSILAISMYSVPECGHPHPDSQDVVSFVSAAAWKRSSMPDSDCI